MLGFYNILKPTGVSSAFVVNKIKKITKQKVGHLGTLDPSASGVLSVAVGKATRFFDYFLNKDKEYIALALFNKETDTLDAEGKIVKTCNKEICLSDIEKVIKNQIGEIDQIPPLYSSKSVNGIRAYDAARQGIEIDLKPKKVQIYDIKAEKTLQKNIFKLKIHCSAGTYVRAIVRDIAKDLSTVATTVCIIRTKSGAFKIDDSVLIDDINEDQKKYLIKINDILHFPEIILSNDQKNDLANGKSIVLEQPDGKYLSFYNDKEFSVLNIVNNLAKNEIYLYEDEKND